MDIGGFRDMHRHRRCIQILQPFTNAHGYEVPEGLAEAGTAAQYDSAMTQAHEAFDRFLRPAWWRMRATFCLWARAPAPCSKWTFAEALYIAELRSAPAGHFSYRRIAWEMYQAVARKHPALAPYFRVPTSTSRWTCCSDSGV
jgi:hypothetical protein